jgi:hypothetical protein
VQFAVLRDLNVQSFRTHRAQDELAAVAVGRPCHRCGENQGGGCGHWDRMTADLKEIEIKIIDGQTDQKKEQQETSHDDEADPAVASLTLSEVLRVGNIQNAGLEL